MPNNTQGFSVVENSSASAGSDANQPAKMSSLEPISSSSLEGESNNPSLAEELQSAKADAKETLLALLQFSEGVRTITRHMQTAATEDNSDSEEEEECKSAEQQQDINSNPSLRMEQMVSETCLKGTVFGTDLLRLWDAAHHVHDYARLVTEESTVSTNDIVAAQRTAKRVIKRAKKAESLALHLHRQNQELRQQLDQLTGQKKCLVQEVKTLRQQAAATRKMDMERLVQQHVAGAILLHEEQLKAMTSQQQQQQHLRKKHREEEEEKKEDDDMEVVKAEDCEGPGLVDDETTIAQPTNAKKTFEVVSTFGNEEEDNKQAQETVAEDDKSVSKESDQQDEPAKVTRKGNAAASHPPPALPSLASNYAPIKLYPSFGLLSPPPPPSNNDKPSSSRSVASNESSQSPTIIPPPQKEHVGSKVFNFLFHPEKIGQQQRLEEEMRQHSRQRQEQEGVQPNQQDDQAANTTKLNPLLALDDLVGEKEDASVDATAPTQAATTPGSTCASSSFRARSMSGDRVANTTSAGNKQLTPKRTSQSDNNNNNNIIPNCVAFSDDTLSVQSNLPSPKFQSKRSMDEDDHDHTNNAKNRDVELYNDFKMFRSLAIPADDEIDDYHLQRRSEQQQEEEELMQ